MTEPWRYRPSQEHLHIFISSRIEECRAERGVVAEAIRSLNFIPILFEHLGARPYPPRDLYLSRLRDSQFMIGIYRLGYGYIDKDNGMEISGLEDEYRFADQNSIDLLCYVSTQKDGRDVRLQALVEEISKGYTISFYEKPEHLLELVRNALTSVVTEKVLMVQNVQGGLCEDASLVLDRTKRVAGVVVSRGMSIEKIAVLCQANWIVCMHGPVGIGKTILAAQFANAFGFKFARLTGITPKEVFSLCAGLIKENPEGEQIGYATLDGARLAFASAWAERKEVFLVLDECDFMEEVLQAIDFGGGTSATKRVLYTSKFISNSYPNFEVPFLTPDEVAQFLPKAKSDPKDFPAEDSGISPLEVQGLIVRKDGTIADLAFKQDGIVNGTLTYLSLSPVPLTMEELIELRGEGGAGVTGLDRDLMRFERIIDDGPRGFRLAHESLSSSIRMSVEASPQRQRYFVRRLVQLALRTERYCLAWELKSSIGENISPEIIRKAINECARLGDWRKGVELIDPLLEEAIDNESKYEALSLILVLISPLELLGHPDKAQQLLGQARGLATGLGGDAMMLFEEVEISSRARKALGLGDVESLEGIYRKYGELGRNWDQARIGIELSALQIAAKNYEKALDILRPALTVFEESGDNYGVDVAERNLAVTLSAMGGWDPEADKLILRIKERSAEEGDSRRLRAWWCNLLSGRLRRSKRLDEAESNALEAISIAESLGDESLRALNYINLGNVLRDKKLPIDAIAAYHKATELGKKCGRLDYEADASRLIAGVYNDFEETGTPTERHEKARYFAQYCIAISRESINYECYINASIELAEAQEFLGQKEDAIESAFMIALKGKQAQNSESELYGLNLAFELSMPKYPQAYLNGISNYLELADRWEGYDISDKFFLMFEKIITMASESSIITILGRHFSWLQSMLPCGLWDGVAISVVQKYKEICMHETMKGESRRVLSSAIVIGSILKGINSPFPHSQLAAAITGSLGGIFVREEDDGARTWTLVLKVGTGVIVSIVPTDASAATNLAATALAAFIKGFENDLNREFIGSSNSISELQINIGSFEELPSNIQGFMAEKFIDESGSDYSSCVVTRPTVFDGKTPTIVVLGPGFLKAISFGKPRGGALSLLFGMTVVEVIFQLLGGEVEMDAIRPKLVSMVHKACP